MNRIAQQVWDLAAPLAKEQGVELWDVTYTKEAGQWYLRVYIDKVFRMYGGMEENVTLKCSAQILDLVIDRFGEEFILQDVKNWRA